MHMPGKLRSNHRALGALSFGCVCFFVVLFVCKRNFFRLAVKLKFTTDRKSTVMVRRPLSSEGFFGGCIINTTRSTVRSIREDGFAHGFAEV